MSAFLLGATIMDVETIEALPVGAVLAGDGMHWQKQADGWWYPSSFSWIKQRGALAMAGAAPTLVWAPYSCCITGPMCADCKAVESDD